MYHVLSNTTVDRYLIKFANIFLSCNVKGIFYCLSSDMENMVE